MLAGGLRLGIGIMLVSTLLAASGAAASPGGMRASSTTYTDERGEQQGAPDITSVVVSNDDAGMITFRVLVPNRRRLTRDMRIRISFTARGKLYSLVVDPYLEPTAIVGLFRCRPGTSGDTVCDTLPGAPTLRFRYAGGARFTFHASEIGFDPAPGSRATIAFSVVIYSGVRFDPTTGCDLTQIRIDRAPSKFPRTWRYVATFDS